MGASVRPDPIDEALAKIRAQSAEPQADDMDAALAKIRATKPAEKPKAPDLRKLNMLSGDVSALNPPGVSPGLKIRNTIEGIPLGGLIQTAIQTGLSKLGKNPLTYEQQYAKNQADYEKIPPGLRQGERLIGGYLAGRALPLGETKTVGQAIKQGAKVGAGLGAADVAGSAKPGVSTEERAVGGLVGGGVGALAGGALGGLTQGVSNARGLNQLRGRINEAPTAGKIATEAEDLSKATGIQQYGTARAKGVERGGTSPVLKETLDRPAIKTYADEIRADAEGPVHDTDLGLDVLKEMNADIRGLKTSLKNNYQPANARTLRALQREAARLKDAFSAPSEVPGEPNLFGLPTHEDVAPVMPEARIAISTKAGQEHSREVFEEAFDRMRHEITGAVPKGKNLKTASSEATMKWIESLSPEDAEIARQGALAAGKTALKIPRVVPNTTMFSQTVRSVGGPAMKLNRLNPFVNALDTQVGGAASTEPLDFQALLRGLTSANAPLAGQK